MHRSLQGLQRAHRALLGAVVSYAALTASAGPLPYIADRTNDTRNLA